LPRTWILLKDSLNFLLEGVPEGIDLCLESGPIGSKFLHPTSPTQIPLATTRWILILPRPLAAINLLLFR